MAFTAEDYEVLEPNVYPAIFVRSEESDTEGQYGFWIDWFFDAQTDDGVVSVMGRSSKPDRFTRSTKARQWTEAILGRELAKAESVDLNKLSGTPVVHQPDGWCTAQRVDHASGRALRRAAARRSLAMTRPLSARVRVNDARRIGRSIT